jgi:TfoX/Sxy family transcriptional regulator of competence genes
MRQVPKGTLVDRVRGALVNVDNVQEKKMFGSVAFMVNGKLCLSARDSRIMCKIDPSLQPDLIARTGVRPMIMKGRKLKGYVYVEKKALRTDSDLRFWVNLAVDTTVANKGKNLKVKI